MENIDAQDDSGVNLSEFYIQGVAVCAGIDINLCDVANPNFGGAYQIALRKVTDMTVHMPFALYEENFREDIWRKLDEFDMDFVATLYPTKKIVHLQNKK